MNRAPHRLAFGLGLMMIVFGFLCLNFTKGFDLDHHIEWATEHGLPAPSYAIFLVGAVLEALGGVVVGYSLGRITRRRARDAT
jgi:hypothetical protein